MLTESSLERAFDEIFETIRAIQRSVEANQARFLLILIPGRDAFTQGTVAERRGGCFNEPLPKSVDLRIPHVDTCAYLEETGGSIYSWTFVIQTVAGMKQSHTRYTRFSRGQTTFRPLATGIPVPKPSSMSLLEPAGAH